jgi:hypothetical protein
LHAKVHPVATAVVAVANRTQRAPALTAWPVAAVVAHVVMAVVVVVVVADLVVVAVAVAEAVAPAAAVAMVVAATAVAVRSVADQQRINTRLAIGPSMVGNGPIIELHLRTAQFTVLGHPAPHSGAPHFE